MSPPSRVSRERRRHDRRHARRPPGRVRRHLAGRRRQAHAEPVQQAARGQRRSRSTPQVWGPTTPPTPGADVGDPVPVSRRDPEHRPRRHRSSSVRTGGAAVPIPPGGAVLVARRCRGCGAHGGGTRRSARDGRASPSSPTGRTSSPRSAAARRSSATARPSSAPASSSRRASSARARRGAPSASSPTGGSSSSPSTAASPGTRSGMTNFELAQALVRLGAVTGMALDSGGSTTMAFDGTLLNRPSRAGAADLDGARSSSTPASSCSRR